MKCSKSRKIFSADYFTPEYFPTRKFPKLQYIFGGKSYPCKLGGKWSSLNVSYSPFTLHTQNHSALVWTNLLASVNAHGTVPNTCSRVSHGRELHGTAGPLASVNSTEASSSIVCSFWVGVLKVEITWPFYMQSIVMGLALISCAHEQDCQESPKDGEVLKQKNTVRVEPRTCTFHIFCILTCPVAIVSAWLDIETPGSPCFGCHAGEEVCTLHATNSTVEFRINFQLNINAL